MNIELIIKKALKSDVNIRGGNSLITKVEHDSKYYCVKNYSDRSDSVNRMLREFESLVKLKDFDAKIFAQPIGYSKAKSVAIYSWLDGNKPPLNFQTIDLMIQVISCCQYISKKSQKNDFKNASDSIFVIDDIGNQIFNRFLNLSTYSSDLLKDIFSSLTESINEIASKLVLHGEPLTVLSVSDLGPHNLLWNELTNELFCIDLEFFGWDDSHKLFIDTLLHPQIIWTHELAHYFSTSYLRINELDLLRLIDMWRFLSVKWSLIILSNFVRNYNSSQIKAQYKFHLNLAHNYLMQSKNDVKTLNDIINSIVKLNKLPLERA